MKPQQRWISICIALLLTSATPLSAAETHHGHGSDTHHQPVPASRSYRAVPTLPALIQPGQPVTLSIDIVDDTGARIERFATVHEKLLHLIVVSHDLQFFSHLHPDVSSSGRFTTTLSFPSGGKYSLFADYTPAGGHQQVSSFEAQVSGHPAPLPETDRRTEKMFADTRITLSFSPSHLKAGQETSVLFTLQQAGDNSPVADLQPYFGAQGHLVIVRQTENPGADDYIHAHPTADPINSTVVFTTSFPSPGRYKLFGQFNRDGQILTADFSIDVHE